MKHNILSTIILTTITGVGLNLANLDLAHASSHLDPPCNDPEPSTDNTELYAFAFDNLIVPQGQVRGFFELQEGDGMAFGATFFCVTEAPSQSFLGLYDDFPSNSFFVDDDGDISFADFLATNGGSGNSNLLLNFLGGNTGFAGVVDGGIVGAPTTITLENITPEDSNQEIRLELGEDIISGEATKTIIADGFGSLIEVDESNPLRGVFDPPLVGLRESKILEAGLLLDLSDDSSMVNLRINGSTTLEVVNLVVEDFIVKGTLEDNGVSLGSVLFSTGKLDSEKDSFDLEWTIEGTGFIQSINSSPNLKMEVRGVFSPSSSSGSVLAYSSGSTFEITAIPVTAPEPTTTPESTSIIGLLISSGIGLLYSKR